jgi:hypothetical protein
MRAAFTVKGWAMTPEELVPEIRKVGHRWIDLSVAGCALVVSVTSLFVAFRHGHSMERMAEANAKLVQANSWPLLQSYQSDVGSQGASVFSLDVVNNGVGPAKIEALEVSWKGQPVRNPRELIALCCRKSPVSQSEPLVQTSGLMGTVLRAGQVREILVFPEDEVHQAMTERMRVSIADIHWHACYCSVFDECWVSDLHTLHPAVVKECPVPKVPFEG